jgi:hypothetical protein
MSMPLAAPCAALAVWLCGCGAPEPATPLAVRVEVRSGPIAWLPIAEDAREGYVEQVQEDGGAWQETWGRQRDMRSPAPDVDFATHRVVVVAQHARHVGYGGARLKTVTREGERAVVEYEGIEPARGTFHAQVYKGYLGFWAAVPRSAGAPAFRRTTRS